MRKATIAIAFLALVGGLYALRLRYPTATLLNETEWTLFGKGSEWFWALMQFVIVTITLVLIYGELRISSAAHMLESLTSLNERWTSKDLVSQRRKICRAHLKGDPVLTLGNQIVFTFFEELGLYVRKGWVPQQVIWDTYSYYIENYWDMCSQEVVDRRKKSTDSSTFEHFDQLAVAMRVINKKRKIPCTRRTKEQLREFAQGEMVADFDETTDRPTSSKEDDIT
jgi:hypothetical protein